MLYINIRGLLSNSEQKIHPVDGLVRISKFRIVNPRVSLYASSFTWLI